VKSTQPLGPLLAATVALLAIAGCGGGDPAASRGTRPPDASADAVRQEARRVSRLVEDGFASLRAAESPAAAEKQVESFERALDDAALRLDRTEAPAALTRRKDVLSALLRGLSTHLGDLRAALGYATSRRDVLAEIDTFMHTHNGDSQRWQIEQAAEGLAG
jgi:hypothetical protein